MHVSLLSLVICVIVAAAAIAVCGHRRAAARRREKERGEWARMAAELRDLDKDLDRLWAVEKERISRGW